VSTLVGTDRRIAKRRILLLVAAWICTLAEAAAAEPSFPAVDAEPLDTVSENAIVLHAGWQMRESVIAGSDGAAFSRAGFPAAGWYATTVPTTTLGTLVRHGVYPDPYVGMNNMLIPDASDDHNRRYNLARYSHLPNKANPWAKPYWFRKEFHLPKGYGGKVVWLHMDGINYRADVWLNGRQVADAKSVVGMFRRFRFDVSSFVSPEETNALAVRIHPLDFPGDRLREQLEGFPGSFGPAGGDGEILHNVTEYCSVGWDSWVGAARDRNVGLWQHVWLEATGPVAVRDPAAMTDVRPPAASEAAVTVRCHLDNSSAVQREVELRVRIAPDGFTGMPVEIRTKVIAPPRALKEIVLKPEAYPSLMLRRPRLWWPVTYGDQPLYRLTVEARVDGHTSSQATRHFGVRTVGSVVLPSGGRAFTVNGRTIRMTGGAWVPDYLMSWSAQRYRDEVRLMAEGNHTIVRVNGCGIVVPDVFLDACDRCGLLVWQDLSRTSVSSNCRKDAIQAWNPPPCDPAIYLANMRDCIIRLRGHPSMLLWCGSNEAAPQADMGRALQNEILPALDGTRPWLPDSHEAPPWRKEDLHTWTGGPYSLVRLPEYFRIYAQEPNATCRNEIGLLSPPPINSIVKAIPDHDQPEPAWFPWNRDLGYHDALDFTSRDSDKIIRQDVGEPACLTEYLWMSDLYSNLAYRAIYEAANKVRPRNAGTHIWKINAAWPSVVQQVFDWRLRCNGGYYGMRSACRPLHVQHSADDHTIQVVSTLAEPRPGLKVRATLVDTAGHAREAREYAVNAAADATTRVGPLPEMIRDGRLHFLALDLLDAEGRQLDRVVTWVQADCRFHELTQLPPVQIDARVSERSEKGGETLYKVSVHNASSVPAVQVWLEVIGGDQGDEVLPAFWSDNALTLLPGERRELTVQFRTALLAAAAPHLMVEGWNVTPREWRIDGAEPVSLAMAVTGCEVRREAKQVKVRFTATERGVAGPRWTTWPVAAMVDGKVARYVRVGLRSGVASSALLTLGGLPAGEHRIAVGNGPARTVTLP
jgi:hypothetical protein